MHAGHPHTHRDHVTAVSDATMGWAVVVTLAFVVAEALAGWFAGSLALLSDAFHNLADAAALGLSWYAIRAAAKPSHHGMTFGYHRIAIVAAFVNSVSLAVRQPEPANGATMIGVALVAVIVNTAIGMRLHRGAEHDINVRSAYLHMIGDAVSAAAVVVAGIIVAFTRTTIADPIVSLLIAGLIVYSTFDIFRDTVTVLLEGTPPGLEVPALAAAIRAVSGVLDVHDLHVWTVGPGMIACSCHILVAEQSVREGQQVLRAVVHELDHGFRIDHTTIQVEVEGCATDDMYCTGSAPLRRGHDERAV
jgi:cobalt-zinc-cadmium efflux system protein